MSSEVSNFNAGSRLCQRSPLTSDLPRGNLHAPKPSCKSLSLDRISLASLQLIPARGRLRELATHHPLRRNRSPLQPLLECSSTSVCSLSFKTFLTACIRTH
ncbi:hypothetical protein C8J57DRAFT_1481021, partial [Mycena rebaudengoi]